MKTKYFVLLACAVFSSALFAQDEKAEPEKKDWQWSGVVGLNASATGLVNWAAGGVNNLNGVAFGKVRLLYDKNSLSWETNLDVEYGLSFLDQKYDKFQKSSDRLDFNTKFGWAFHPTWYLTAQAGFKTQFDLGRTYTGTPDFNPVISNILAPSYTDISVGIDWKPNSIFSVYLSPVAGRITTAYVSDALQKRFADQYAVDADGNGGIRDELREKYGTWSYVQKGEGYEKRYTNAKASLGLNLKGTVNYTYKDLKVMTTLSLFTPYAWDKTKLYTYNDGIYTEAWMIDKQKEDPSIDLENMAWKYRDNNQRFGNFDVDWTVAVSYQFLKCLNVTLSTDLKYYNGVLIADKEGNMAERVQFKAVLGLGVGYAF
jgi:hypothetical protein